MRLFMLLYENLDSRLDLIVLPTFLSKIDFDLLLVRAVFGSFDGLAFRLFLLF